MESCLHVPVVPIHGVTEGNLLVLLYVTSPQKCWTPSSSDPVSALDLGLEWNQHPLEDKGPAFHSQPPDPVVLKQKLL